MQALAISCIRRDGGTQPRATLNLNWVEDYGQDMLAGHTFPPVVVFYDGTDHWLADGFHRTEAAEAVGLVEILADVRQGTQRDAILYSVGANGTHGQRRTNDDKRRAVLKLLNDPEWSGWSDREVARQCGVSQPFVTGLRLIQTDNGYQSATRTFIHSKTGQPTQMRTAAINQRRPPAAPSATAYPPARPAPPRSATTSLIRPSSAPRSSIDPEPEFDRASADLHRDLMIAVATFAVMPSARAAQDACNKHTGRGVLPSVVSKAAVWLTEFATLYAQEEPRRVEIMREIFGAAA